MNHSFAQARFGFAILLIIIAAAFGLASCNGNGAPAIIAANPGKDIIVPQAGNGIVLDKNSLASGSEQNSASHDPKIAIDPNYLVQSVVDENIDADPAIEQIIVFKLKNDQEDLLRIMVVDFDEGHGSWTPTWQGLTRAVNIKTFSIRVLDLTADGLPELVCHGTNKAGELTLDIFKIAGASSAFPIQCASVLSISADISLEVQRSTDTAQSGGDDFAENTVPSKPVDIIAQSKDLESQSQLDMVQTTYRWKSSRDNPAGGQFIVAATLRVPGNTVQETALDLLFRSNIADFERKYLAGAWLHSFINQSKKPINQILFFDPEARTIRLIEGDRMESHEWPSSRKPPYGGTIQASLINENFQSLHTTAQIQAKELNLLSFALQDRNDWTGDFTRMSPEQEESYFARSLRKIPINRLVLNGLFHSENGLEIVFASPHFSWRIGDQRKQGGYINYQLNQNVIEFKFLNSHGLLEKEQYYIATLEENQQAHAKVLRILTLYPAIVNVEGISRDVTSTDVLHLEQRASDVAP